MVFFSPLEHVAVTYGTAPITRSSESVFRRFLFISAFDLTDFREHLSQIQWFIWSGMSCMFIYSKEIPQCCVLL